MTIVLRNQKIVRSLLHAFVVALIVVCFGSFAQAEGVDLDRLNKPLNLTAIPNADNGKAIGMKVVLARGAVKYKGIAGTLELGAPVRFELQKMAKDYRSVYENADGAYIYPIKNWVDIENLNKKNIHFGGRQAPRYIYIYRGIYKPTSRPAIFLCTIRNPDVGSFYETGSGHGRCDVFSGKSS